MAPAAQRAQGTVLEAVCSRTPGEAARCAQSFGFRSSYGSFDEMLADPRVDVVYVATPDDLHAVQAIEAARAGKHVLVEKPLALHEADAQAVVEAGYSAAVVVEVGHQLRCHAAHREVKQRVLSGELGRILGAEFTFATEPPGGGPAGDTSHRESDILARRMVHLIDLALYLLPLPPRNVSAAFAEPEMDGPNDTVVALLELQGPERRGRMFATLTTSSSISGGRDGIIVYGSEKTISLSGSYAFQGTILYEMRGQGAATVVEYASEDPYRAEIEEFNERVRTSTLSQGVNDAVRGIRILTAMRESGGSRRWVEL
jgi:1,5-anhydro-D-fructose reductase (1,5-anhydro-D-mannitol-forming)